MRSAEREEIYHAALSAGQEEGLGTNDPPLNPGCLCVNRPGFTGGAPALSLAGGSACEADGALSHLWDTSLKVRILGVRESGGTPQWIQLASVGRLSPNWLGDLELPAVNRHL